MCRSLHEPDYRMAASQRSKNLARAREYDSNAQEYSRLQSSSVIRALLVGRLEDALVVLAGSSSLSPVLLWLILARFLL